MAVVARRPSRVYFRALISLIGGRRAEVEAL